ncbi:hypothetical protein ACGKZZ_17270, partial [Marivita sp. S2033]
RRGLPRKDDGRDGSMPLPSKGIGVAVQVSLTGFAERYNAKFAKAPAKPDNLHRALNIDPDRLVEVFCLRDKRYVTKDLTLKYDRKRIRLEVNDLTRGLVGTYVDVYEMPDGRIQVRAKGVALPCSIFDPHQQRVTHAAITENKHLSVNRHARLTPVLG